MVNCECRKFLLKHAVWTVTAFKETFMKPTLCGQISDPVNCTRWTLMEKHSKGKKQCCAASCCDGPQLSGWPRTFTKWKWQDSAFPFPYYVNYREIFSFHYQFNISKMCINQLCPLLFKYNFVWPTMTSVISNHHTQVSVLDIVEPSYIFS